MYFKMQLLLVEREGSIEFRDAAKGETPAFGPELLEYEPKNGKGLPGGYPKGLSFHTHASRLLCVEAPGIRSLRRRRREMPSAEHPGIASLVRGI